MMKAKIGNTMVLGLSDKNLELLKAGKPIKFNMDEIGMGDIIVLIFNEKDEDAMREKMKDMINPKTTIVHDNTKTPFN